MSLPRDSTIGRRNTCRTAPSNPLKFVVWGACFAGKEVVKRSGAGDSRDSPLEYPQASDLDDNSNVFEPMWLGQIGWGRKNWSHKSNYRSQI